MGLADTQLLVAMRNETRRMRHTLLTLILILTLVMISMSCVDRQKNQNGEMYETIVHYEDNSGRLKSDAAERYVHEDTLYIFFEFNYASDTVTVKTNRDDKTKKLYLTTDKLTGLADVIEFEDINSLKWIEVKKNDGKSLTFELKEKWMNKWTVNFYQDTLRADVLKFAPFYD